MSYEDEKLNENIHLYTKKLPNGLTLLVIGVPDGALKNMQNGQYQNMDLRDPQNLPILLSVFSEKTGKDVRAHFERIDASILKGQIMKSIIQ